MSRRSSVIERVAFSVFDLPLVLSLAFAETLGNLVQNLAYIGLDPRGESE